MKVFYSIDFRFQIFVLFDCMSVCTVKHGHLLLNHIYVYECLYVNACRVMEFADIIAEIPTFGVKNSLNVASALPIVLFEVLRQWES